MNKNRTTGSYKTLVETTGSLSEAISLKEKNRNQGFQKFINWNF